MVTKVKVRDNWKELVEKYHKVIIKQNGNYHPVIIEIDSSPRRIEDLEDKDVQKEFGNCNSLIWSVVREFWKDGRITFNEGGLVCEHIVEID